MPGSGDSGSLENALEMVGGGIRRDDAAPGISSKNVFAALETLKKKKKSSVKDSKGSSKSKESSKGQGKEPVAPQEFWVPAPLNKSWADVDDDDDDYYKSAPVLPGWETTDEQPKDSLAPAEEESESEDDGLDDGDDDIEEETEQEHEAPHPVELITNKPTHAPVASKDPERQLSKKEQKKKELDELDALLAEFAVTSKDEKTAAQSENNAAIQEKNPDEQAKELDSENPAAPAETKASKKKKGKKEKSSKDANGSDGAAVPEAVEEPAAGIDVKEKLKKIASTKKKKSGKEMDAASKIASTEAAARSAKLAAAKKKEKSNYNQQPVR